MATKKADRRQHLRQQRTERSVSWWRGIRDSVGTLPLLYGCVFCAAATTIALYGSHAHRFRIGQQIEQPIYAETDFDVEDEQETLRRQQAARAAAPSHYRINVELIATIATELQNLYQTAQASETYEAFAAAAGPRGWNAEQGAYDELRRYADDQDKRFESSVDRLRAALRRETTWRGPDSAQRTPASTAEHILVHDEDPGATAGAPPREVAVFDLTPISNRKSIQRAANDLARDKSQFAAVVRPAIVGILAARLGEAPMLVFDSARTNQEMSAAQDAVEPERIHYRAGEPLIPPGRTLTAADLQLLDRHQAEYAAFLKSDDQGARMLRERRLWQQVGVATIFVLTTVGLFGYVGSYQKRIFEVNARAVALVVLLLGAMLTARVIDARVQIKELIYTPPLFAGAVLALAYSRRFAVGAMAFVSALTVLCVRGDLATFVTMMVGVASIVNMLNEIRTRTRLLLVGAVSAAAIFVAASSFGLMDGQTVAFATIHGAWAAAAALLAAMLIQTLLPLIERAFRIATSLTLLEWKDPTRPLLQRLAHEAPGTYAHSLNLGEMASSACNAIGANGLLAQVAALYHDIGKLNKPEYFTENQEAHINRHDNLAPTMSLLIIIGHVKDGVEMAKEYRLPRVLHPFIEEHHGTTVVRYFHHMASEKQPRIASGKHDREVPEARFRYPGPKPRTKESAILMICDGAEGAVRALAEPTPGRIEQVVHQILTSRLDDGQFGDCDITLRELHRVEESLVKSLCSQYHGRVAYPKRERADQSARQEQETERKPIAS